jgi:hypothetical protein
MVMDEWYFAADDRGKKFDIVAEMAARARQGVGAAAAASSSSSSSSSFDPGLVNIWVERMALSAAAPALAAAAAPGVGAASSSSSSTSVYDWRSVIPISGRQACMTAIQRLYLELMPSGSTVCTLTDERLNQLELEYFVNVSPTVWAYTNDVLMKAFVLRVVAEDEEAEDEAAGDANNRVDDAARPRPSARPPGEKPLEMPIEQLTHDSRTVLRTYRNIHELHAALHNVNCSYIIAACDCGAAVWYGFRWR